MVNISISIIHFFKEISLDEPMPGNDANSPSITNQLRNEELERIKAVTNNYDMFSDDYSDNNVNIILKTT